MPVTCSVPECRSRFKKGDGIQFFGFPLKDQVRIAAWTTAINRPNWTPNKNSKICSKHFVPSDYLPNAYRPNAYIKYLKDNTVPSAFPSRTFCQLKMQEQKITYEKIQKKNQENEDSNINTGNQTVDNISTESSSIENEIKKEISPQQSSLKPLHITFLPDWNIDVDKSTGCDSSTNNSLSSYKVSLLRHKIRMLQQNVRRRDKQINSLKLLIEKLRKQENLESDSLHVL